MWICEHCGKQNSQKPKAERAHGYKRYKWDHCRCEICTKANEAKYHGYKKRRIEATPAPHRRGYVWTGPELELASRTDLTAREVAQMIGRTALGVKAMRRKLYLKFPREILLAGVPIPHPTDTPQRMTRL